MQGTAAALLTGSGATGVYAALIDTGVYTYSASHEFYSDISAGVVGTPVELASKTYTTGTFDAADLTFTAVTGSSVEAIIFYVKNAGANTTWRLVCYRDTGITGLPVTPNGGDISLGIPSGVFTL